MPFNREPKTKKRLGPKWTYHLSYSKAKRLGKLFDQVALEFLLGVPSSGDNTMLPPGVTQKRDLFANGEKARILGCHSNGVQVTGARMPQLSGRKLRLMVKDRELSISRAQIKRVVK